MATAELEYLQVMFRDAVRADVQEPDWQEHLSPCQVVLPSTCSLVSRQEQQQVVDAKSAYDVISRGSPGGRQDRRTAVDLAIIAEAMTRAKATIHWVPHGRMAADVMTHVD
eukprot:14906460-Alexandrium_andersonii.AAC.1